MAPANSTDSPIIPPNFRISALEQAGGVVGLLAAAGVTGSAGWLWRRKPAWLALAGAGASALAGVLWLFRSPDRSTAGGPGLAVAPCDGQVSSIALIHEPRFLKAQAFQIIVRVRPGNVQVMRAPVGGTVRYRRYQPRGQAGAVDDTLWIGVRQPIGARVLIQLTASPIWRLTPSFAGQRITALIELEDAVRQGQIIGHLPLGGQVQIYIPASAQLAVKPGVRTRAGETNLGKF